jgi:small-conductance mechanosensitive channel
MILIDHPFHIGDRLKLPSLDSWGDVVEIGMRSTKILSMENRMVILPNSVAGKDQIVNYSYSDHSYFNLVKVMVAYDNDPDQVSEILEGAIRSVEDVQTEREVVAWLMELIENQMVYWTTWWVATYQDRYAVQDQVNKAMIMALKEAGVVLPYRKERVDLDKSLKGTGS